MRPCLCSALQAALGWLCACLGWCVRYAVSACSFTLGGWPFSGTAGMFAELTPPAVPAFTDRLFPPPGRRRAPLAGGNSAVAAALAGWFYCFRGAVAFSDCNVQSAVLSGRQVDMPGPSLCCVGFLPGQCAPRSGTFRMHRASPCSCVPCAYGASVHAACSCGGPHFLCVADVACYCGVLLCRVSFRRAVAARGSHFRSATTSKTL